MRKRTKTVRSTGKIKAGVQCPVCSDVIFSLYAHDFRRCMCGKVFVDGGDDYMRTGAEPPVDPQNIINVYRPQREAERLMSAAVRSRLPAAPPPLSYFTNKGRYRIRFHAHPKSWGLGGYGPYPKGGKFAGSIFSWQFMIGPMEICRWADSESPI